MKVSWPPRNRSIGVVDALAITGLLGLLVARFIPVAKLPFWGCLLRERTGWPCLGCGLTRVAENVSHFNVWAAWAANPLGTVVALGFVACIAASFVHLVFRVPLPELSLSGREQWAGRVLVIVAVVVNYAWMAVKAKFPSLLAFAGG